LAVPLSELRDAAKDLCDHQVDDNVGDPTWNRWINDGIEKLWRIVARLDAGVFQTSTNFTLTAASNLQAKPATFRRLIGVTRDPSVPGLRRSLPKYNFGERDSMGLLGPLSYREIGTNISIEPANICAGNYALYYIAGPTKLTADVDVVDSVLEPYDDYVTTWAAIKALGKEESDNRDLYSEIAQLEETITWQFANGGGDDPSTIVDDDARGPAWPVPFGT
jgi:hypothetical protein